LGALLQVAFDGARSKEDPVGHEAAELMAKFPYALVMRKADVNLLEASALVPFSAVSATCAPT